MIACDLSTRGQNMKMDWWSWYITVYDYGRMQLALLIRIVVRDGLNNYADQARGECLLKSFS